MHRETDVIADVILYLYDCGMSEEIVPELLSSCSDDWVCCCLIDAHCNYCDTQSETHPPPDHKLGQSDTVLINTSIMYNEKS